MTRIHSRRVQRSAFTLVELMVVVLIIAILVSLVSSAVMKAMRMIPEVTTRTEISEMETAMGALMQDYKLDVPPPSFLILDETSPRTPSPVDGGRSAAFLTKMFGRNLGPTDWNGDNTIGGTWTLRGEECLVFYLGGINLQGFSYNNMSPKPISGQKVHGPYFPFKTSRLKPVVTGFYVYIDPWQKKSGPHYATLGGSPYTYFSSNGINNAYTNTSGYGAFPYFITGTTQYMNSNSFQIISAGQDGYFGGQQGWVPASGATGTGADDQANFSAKLLGAPQQ